ncbi:MAG: hypothetical protein GVY02_03410 [Bacteroidetes bacterium]|jgi:hypothetical protein|nr:hypothetical protein [Bacteroidota bacterium]
MQVVLTLVLGFFMLFNSPVSTVDLSDNFAGSWAFDLPQAPPQYSKGVVHLEMTEDGAYTGKVTFDAGGEVPLRNVRIDGENIILSVFVEGSVVDTVCSIDEGMLKGTVMSPNGNMPFSAQRVELTEESG